MPVARVQGCAGGDHDRGCRSAEHVVRYENGLRAVEVVELDEPCHGHRVYVHGQPCREQGRDSGCRDRAVAFHICDSGFEQGKGLFGLPSFERGDAVCFGKAQFARVDQRKCHATVAHRAVRAVCGPLSPPRPTAPSRNIVRRYARSS
ncbi:hypothetical protein [Kibdelosporangium philippinense]|uniref:hypothetical protein n=1 Tax=Kibdelosporangium philippinense TaxID=211113 RepID=UPI003611DC70